MSCAVDRTSDFIKSVQISRTKNATTASPDGGKSRMNGSVSSSSHHHGNNTVAASQHSSLGTALGQRSTFMQMAQSIGLELTATLTKLEHLSRLARQSQSLFTSTSSNGSQGDEIGQLTLTVKQDMAELNHRIADLQEFVKQQQQQRSRKQKQQSTTHSQSILVGLQSRLARMSDKFKGLLEQRSRQLRSQAQRRGQFSALASSRDDSVPLLPRKPPSILLQDEVEDRLMQEQKRLQRANQTSSSVAVDIDALQQQSSKRSGEESAVMDHDQQRLQSLVAMDDQTNSYLSQRADAMQSIEHTIVELGQIFQQLAVMVHEQEESVDRIDTNVEQAALSIEAGHSELVQYLRSISSNRWLMFKIFAILIVFFIIFVVFFV